jgi:hypothetical protein
MNAKINVNSNLKLILEKYARLAMFEDCDIKSPESPDPAGDTPFHMAAYSGDIEAVRIMFPYISDINFGGDNGDTPLHYAIMNRNPELARFLILNGADVLKKNDYGDTPIEDMEDHEIFRELLIELKNGI